MVNAPAAGRPAGVPFHDLAEKLYALKFGFVKQLLKLILPHQSRRRHLFVRLVIGGFEYDDGGVVTHAQVHGHHFVAKPIAVNAATPLVAKISQHFLVKLALGVVGVNGRAVGGFPTCTFKRTIVRNGLGHICCGGDAFQTGDSALSLQFVALLAGVLPQVFAPCLPVGVKGAFYVDPGSFYVVLGAQGGAVRWAGMKAWVKLGHAQAQRQARQLGNQRAYGACQVNAFICYPGAQRQLGWLKGLPHAFGAALHDGSCAKMSVRVVQAQQLLPIAKGFQGWLQKSGFQKRGAWARLGKGVPLVGKLGELRDGVKCPGH